MTATYIQASQAELARLCPGGLRTSCSRWHLVMEVRFMQHNRVTPILAQWQRIDPMAEDIARLEASLADYDRYHASVESEMRMWLSQRLWDARRFLLRQAQLDDAALALTHRDTAQVALEWAAERLASYRELDALIRDRLTRPK